MPVRSREMNDQPTEARIRQVIRSILDQEIRRVLTSSSALSTTVATNTSNISANASGIAANVIAICNNQRRAAARNNDGLVSSSALTGGGSLEIAELGQAAQVWTAQITQQPMAVTMWKRQSFTSDALFDTFMFDTQLFDDAVEVIAMDVTTQATYTPSTGTFEIDWGVSKSGTLYTITSGDYTQVVAVAD